MKVEKDFDCVKIVREIRSKMFEENKDKSFEEFIDYINENAKNSSLWKQFADNTENVNLTNSKVAEYKSTYKT